MKQDPLIDEIKWWNQIPPCFVYFQVYFCILCLYLICPTLMVKIVFYLELLFYSYNILYLRKLIMCFVKAVNASLNINHSLIYWGRNQGLPEVQEFKSETPNWESPKQQSDFGTNVPQNKYHTLLLNLFFTNLARNYNSMNIINEKIAQCEEKIDDFFHQLKGTQNEAVVEQRPLKQINSEVSVAQDPSSMKQQFSQNVLTNKLFGQKKYKYRLTLQEDFPEVIYKERNIKVNLSLRNLDGEFIKNSNILNLCFALVDDNGGWINLNRVRDPMLKGKTEVQLYHGEAQFNKIYTKDISRSFPNGKVSIAIYTKPSTLIYNGLESEFTQHVDENCVQPLLIRDITIKAKKKY